MTLIVVRKTAGSITAVSDTRLEPEAGRTWSFLDQSNKLVCLKNGWCVGYAGNTAYAESAIGELLRLPEVRFSEIQSRLLKANQQSFENESQADFVVFSSPSMAIHKFSDGKHSKFDHTAYAGDTAAYSKFQEIINHPGGVHLHPNSGSVKDDPTRMTIGASHLNNPNQGGRAEERLGQMSRAMVGVINDPLVPSVGGFQISLFIDHRGRNFWPGIAVYPTAKIPASEERDKLFGTAAAGDYNYEVITSRDGSSNFVAVYFRITQRAMIFLPHLGKLPYGKIVDNLPTDDAHQILESRFGIPLWRVSLTRRSDGSYVIAEFGYPYE